MLAVVRAADLPTRPENRTWLVDQLWGEEAVGVLGGEPKCMKSFLSLDLAVSVASGHPCLGKFHVANPGRVLLFAAEDALWDVRHRLDGIARSRGLDLDALDIQVVTAAMVRLDLAGDREDLDRTIAAMCPRLVILDPFVRLHRVDENAVSEVAPLLAFLRGLQKAHRTAILLVHHARKGAGHLRGGQALRGSSELHAWGDSNLYMRRRSDGLTLSVEHRNARSISPVSLDLVTHHGGPALAIVDSVKQPDKPATIKPEQRILHALRQAHAPLTLRQIRMECQLRTETASAVLAQLVVTGAVQRSPMGYTIAKTGPETESLFPPHP